MTPREQEIREAIGFKVIQDADYWVVDPNKLAQFLARMEGSREKRDEGVLSVRWEHDTPPSEEKKCMYEIRGGKREEFHAENCGHSPTPPDAWEEEFDQQFHTPNAGTAWGDMTDVKDFIRTKKKEWEQTILGQEDMLILEIAEVITRLKEMKTK